MPALERGDAGRVMITLKIETTARYLVMLGAGVGVKALTTLRARKAERALITVRARKDRRARVTLQELAKGGRRGVLKAADATTQTQLLLIGVFCRVEAAKLCRLFTPS